MPSSIGLSSAAEEFQNGIQTTLHGIQKTINTSDDILVHSCTQAEHDDNNLRHSEIQSFLTEGTSQGDGFFCDILMSCYVLEEIIARLHIDIWLATDCRVYAIVHYLPLYLGINSIMLVAVERFVAIVLPTRFRAFVAPGMVKLQLTFVWLLTFVELIFPWCYMEKVFKFGGRHSCTVYYNPRHYFYMSLTAIILPAVFLLTLYGSIVGVVVHRQRKLNASIAPDPAGGVASVLSTMTKEQAARRQRRAIRVAVTCAVVTILFLVCWLPLWVLFFLHLFRVAHVSITVYKWMAVFIYLHPCMNPVVYFIADDRFRSVFLRLVCRKDTDVGVSVQTPSSVNNATT
ncbi:hypothetical protein LSAT2_016923 [Lamellibrachia satsuma]|nr:hypothetical protein LSAT2_016923 [Lamellibrachia satsuma]